MHNCSPPLAHGNVKSSTIHVQHHGVIKIGAVPIEEINNHVKTIAGNQGLPDMEYVPPEEFTSFNEEEEGISEEGDEEAALASASTASAPTASAPTIADSLSENPIGVAVAHDRTFIPVGGPAASLDDARTGATVGKVVPVGKEGTSAVPMDGPGAKQPLKKPREQLGKEQRKCLADVRPFLLFPPLYTHAVIHIRAFIRFNTFSFSALRLARC